MLVIVECIWRKPVSTYAITVSHWWLRWIRWIMACPLLWAAIHVRRTPQKQIAVTPATPGGRPNKDLIIYCWLNLVHGIWRWRRGPICYLHFCSDDEHTDREPERHRPGCVVLHAVDRYCRGGRHSYVTPQHLRSVRLSYLADKNPSLGIPRYINLRNSSHGIGSLHCSHLSDLVQSTCW